MVPDSRTARSQAINNATGNKAGIIQRAIHCRSLPDDLRFGSAAIALPVATAEGGSVTFISSVPLLWLACLIEDTDMAAVPGSYCGRKMGFRAEGLIR